MANQLARHWMARSHQLEGRAWYAALLGAVGSAEPALRAGALNRAGSLAAQQGDNAAARLQLEQALALYRELGGHAREIASVLNNLGISAQHDGDYALAVARYEENIAILRTLQSVDGLSRSLHNLGDLHQQLGDFDASQALLEEALMLARRHGDRHGVALSLGSLGLLAAQQGRHAQARAWLIESLALDEAYSPRTVASTFEALAFVDVATGHHVRAVQLWGAAASARESLGAAMPSNERSEHLDRIAKVRALLADDAAFEQVWQRGAAMSPEQALRYALGSGSPSEA
jgi:tetratricopeptide (TPR) repeat protein